MEYCFTAEYTAMPTASATDKMVTQNASWSVGPSERQIIDETWSWVCSLTPKSPETNFRNQFHHCTTSG